MLYFLFTALIVLFLLVIAAYLFKNSFGGNNIVVSLLKFLLGAICLYFAFFTSKKYINDIAKDEETGVDSFEYDNNYRDV